MRWPLEEAAIVTVPFDGGLPDGVHEVSIELRLRMSYIPEEHQPSDLPGDASHVTLSPEAAGAPVQVRRLALQLHDRLRHRARPRDRARRASPTSARPASRSSARGTSPNYPEPDARSGSTEWFALLEKYGARAHQLRLVDRHAPALQRAERLATCRPTRAPAMLQRDLRLAKRLGFRFVRPKIGVVSSDLVPAPDLDRGRSSGRSTLAAGARRRDLPRDPLADPDQARGRRRATSSSSSAPARSTSAS